MHEIYVTRPSMPAQEEYYKEISDIWGTHYLTNMGNKHNILEEKLRDYLKAENVSLFCNGHMALELLIQAMGLSGEVITTPFTFASTTHAIVRNGLEPVFCDVNADDYTIDTEKIEQLITEKTSAIIPVHVYGHVCDVEAIDKIARKYNLKVIYDAAHAFGVNYRGKGIAEFGDASIFSFHATKVFNTIEGGAACYKDSEIGERLYQLKNFGIQSETVVNGVGANAKMNEFQAAMGICNLRHIDEEISKREKVFHRYLSNLCDIKEVKINLPKNDIKFNFAYFPIVFNKEDDKTIRDKVYDRLRTYGIYTRKYFYPLTSTFECYHGKYDASKTPMALNISNNVLTLPLFADLELEDVDRIAQYIKQILVE